jgi:DNA-binding LacI/PurR family transcriptional regulator
MPKTVTFQDVANAAGVSVATVSRVARGIVRVSPEVEARVRSSALKLGLNLNEHTNMKIAGFLFSNRPLLHPFHSLVMLAAERYFAAHDYNLMFLSLNYDDKVNLQDLHMPPVLQRRGLVCGYILAARIYPNLLEFFRLRGIPSAVLGNHVMGEWQDDQCDVVWLDDIQGAYEATRFLQSLGHRDIWFIGARPLTGGPRRYEGYRRAMVEAGLSSQTSDINSNDYFELGYLSTKSILNRGEPLTAIVAASDIVAQGVYRALSDCGLQVPQDVSVVGFDDIEAAFMHPPLTTIRVFADEIGRELAEMLLNRITHPDLAPQRNIIPTRLVKRESHRSLSGKPRNENEAREQNLRL